MSFGDCLSFEYLSIVFIGHYLQASEKAFIDNFTELLSVISYEFDCFAVAEDFNIHIDNAESSTAKELITFTVFIKNSSQYSVYTALVIYSIPNIARNKLHTASFWAVTQGGNISKSRVTHCTGTISNICLSMTQAHSSRSDGGLFIFHSLRVCNHVI